MASFKDKTGQEWTVSLDPVIADEINQDHGINLLNLQEDPMLKLRTDPRILFSAMLVICRDQMQERNLTREQTLKRLPLPPDSMLKAIEESIVSFFPTGRHSHILEMLTTSEDRVKANDTLIAAKTRSIAENPVFQKAISDKADREMSKALTALIDSPVGT